MTDLNHQLLGAELDLYRTLTSSEYPFFNEPAMDLSFTDTPIDHEFRVALYRTLIANAKVFETTANLLATVTRAHGLPPIC
jgi:hypothetical protein